MIKEVFIFRHTTGELLFGHSTGGQWENVDKSLVTSFLSALFQFSKEIGEEEVRSLIMSDSTYHYKSWKDVTFSLVTTLDYDPFIIKSILEEIKARFLNRFYGIINGWEGSIETFNKFSEVVKQSLLELDKRNKILHILPHSMLVSNDDISPLPRDAEIASIFALAEKNKKRTKLFGRSKETIVTFSKLLVPIFIEPLKDGYLLIDGLGLIHQKIQFEHFLDVQSLKNRLFIANGDNLIPILKEIQTILKMEGEEGELDSIVDVTLLDSELFDRMYESVTDFAHVIIPMLSEEEILDKKEQYLNWKREIQQIIYELNELAGSIGICAESMKTELEECYDKTKKIYDNELELLEIQIKYNQELLEDEHETKKSKILQSYDDKQVIIRAELRTVAEGFSELFKNISEVIISTLNQTLQSGPQKEQTKALIADFSQLLDNLIAETSKIQEWYQRLQSKIRSKKMELKQLELACNEELNQLKQEYQKRKKAEEKKLTYLEEEKATELTKLKQSIEIIDTTARSTIDIIEYKITRLQREDQVLNQYLYKRVDRLSETNKIYIPFYLIQYASTSTKISKKLRSEVIPPVRIVRAGKGTVRIQYYTNFEEMRARIYHALNQKKPMAEAVYSARERCDYLHKPRQELIVSDVLSWLSAKGIISEKMLNLLKITQVPPFKSIKEVIHE
ncbi:MAG: hypothetical protein ACFFCW_01660 [Candidatus Hodarchaeota archaeon]